MALAVRHRDENIVALPALAALVVRRESNALAMAKLQRKPEVEMVSRIAAGNRAYVASWNGVDAAWGWVATHVAEIGELSIRFAGGT